MGKVQSKHGECFLVDAHFNPLCQVEETLYNKSNRHKSFGCSELSFSLCEDNCLKSPTPPNERFPMQVVLPPEDKTPKMKKKFNELEEKEETPEKAEEEKNEKEDVTEATCSVTIDDKEKQEFSFTLYDFDGHSKFSKEDVEKVVMRSICDALGKTLKLPPSGSRTIKVRLAVTPDSSTDSCTKEEENSEYENKAEHDNNQTCRTLDSDFSANTNSTYVCMSNDEKCPDSHIRYHSPQLERIPSPIVKSTASPGLKSRRTHQLNSVPKQEGVDWSPETGEKLCFDNENKRHHHNGQNSLLEEHRHRHRHRHQHREHITECKDRRNHYLDLAETDNCNDGSFLCPYRLLDRNHVCSKLYRGKETTEQIRRTCVNEDLGNSHIYKNRSFVEPKRDILNLSFDMCSWEGGHQHRRSKSYDIYENSLHNPNITNSPKIKQRPRRSSSLNPNGMSPMSNHNLHSPTHHHQRHREREKEHQRAMQRVASWIEREHLGSNNQKEQLRHYSCFGHSRRTSQLVVERHEHHHLHEHVHHHYHHVES